MKRLLFISLLFFSCQKNNDCVSGEVIRFIIKGCGGSDTTWGIKAGNKMYAADFTDSIPAEFQQAGLKVCLQYDTVMYYFMCPCCYDGPYARIKSIRKAE